jgi:YD repeat-containing protein
MGRVQKQSNPTETSISIAGSPINPTQFIPLGDDAPANGGFGWKYTEQTYDWKGRPLVTTNQDGTTKEASYEGCGCAGGEVVTLADEGTFDAGAIKRRRQKIYSDVLGRTVKTETFNWQGGSVYSTTVNTYNALDQLMQVRQYAGAEGSGAYQDITMTYDGYGRVKTRHRPEQKVDPNNGLSTDNTSWDYNRDDTVQKRTDARGASQIFSYNGRHLITGLTYTAPEGIMLTAPVNYGYDAVGNRIWMTDGNGRSDYTYNELSQMQSEARQFTGVTGSHALRYDYNLAGELKSITDPANATIEYGYDASGRITNITGSPYGGVSQYASGFMYRAWGAIKGLTYGNNLTLSMNYDSRVNLTEFEVAGRPPQYGSWTVMKTKYQYYDDGDLKYADDLLDERFDRAYGYDQTRRLKEDYSGSEARDFINQPSSGTITGPYRQTFTYDVWSNTTSRTGRFWSRPTTFTASYSDGRNTNSLWQHDADGRVLRDQFLKYTYDAAGRNLITSSIFVTQLIGGRVTQSRDGDGLEIKREETREGVTTIGYRLRSSVLGGRVVTELNASGQKQKSYVYVGGAPLAEQEGGFVVWWHTNPLTGSEGRSFITRQYSGQKEIDPLLVDVGFDDPYLNFEEPKLDSLQLLGGNSNGQCTVEGMTWDCMSADRLVEVGAADQMVSSTVFAIYKSGKIKAIWSGLVSANSVLTAEQRHRLDHKGGPGGAGSNGSAENSGFVVFAGTSDSSVTIFAGAAYASTGPQNSLVTDNRSIIDNTGQGQDCDVSVSFMGDSINDMKNGENYYHGNPGLGFTVNISGLGAGGIASIGENKVDLNGKWILQQLMNLTFWTVRTGDTSPETGYIDTFSDSVDPASIIRWDNKSGGWIDHPGPNLKNAAGQQLIAHHSKWNFLIKAYNGKKNCRVAFHVEMIFSNGHFRAHWGPGLY